MAWQDEMVELLRVMTMDLGPTFRNSTTNLERVLVGAARIVESELDFNLTYNADLANRDITPDPTDADAGTRDDNFVNLVCLKAGAIIDQGAVRAESGIVIRDNGSMVDLHYKLETALKLVQGKGGFAVLYEEAKLIYLSDQITGVLGGQVMGPFRTIAAELYGWEDQRTYR
jgi:hypothetical protein